MGTRFVLALGLGLASLLPGQAFGVEHFAFGLTPSLGFDVYQDGTRVLSNRPSSGSGALIFESTGGGSFQLVGTGETVDTIPPAAITTLASTGTTQTSVALRWTSTGDDGTTGTSASFDIRYATTVITSSNWGSATQVSGEPSPLVSGTVQTFAVTGLSSGQTYYFAMKATDDAGNTSGLSNVISATTAAPVDVTSPAQVTTLTIPSVTTSSIALRWNAVGDDGLIGRATAYDVRYSLSVITQANFLSATQATGEPSPLPSGMQEDFTVSGLTSNTRYYFALRVADEANNWSLVSNVVNATTANVGDVTSPAQVTTLATGAVSTSEVSLGWTAVGDDGTTGQATTYDVRYSTSIITSANFLAATQATGEPAPAPNGSQESFTVSGLSSSTQYYFALRVGDEANNWSPVSNVVTATTGTSGGGGHDFVLEGWGSDTPGGSGGTPYVVTSLADSGPGTLRDAVSVGNRNIRFSVGGTIQLQTTLDVKGAFLTIDGETAPAPGITIKPATAMSGYLVRLNGSNNAHDVILRHLRFLDAKGSGADNVRVDGAGAYNIVFDHCSFRRAADGNLDLTNGAHDVTVQWCILAAAPENSLARTGVERVTFHHNLFYAGEIKSPRIRDNTTDVDIVNNVVHEWGSGGYGSDFATGGSGNLVNNYFSVGPDADPETAIDIESSAGLVYSVGNTIPAGSDGTGTTSTRFSAPPIQETTATEARAAVLEDAGAAPRDADDTSYVAAAGETGGGNLDTTAPAAVVDLRSVATTQTTVRLAWSAPGDDGTTGLASAYDLRYSTSPISAQNFASAQAVIGEPLPGLPGTSQSFTIASLADGTTYYFALQTADEELNWSPISNVPQATTEDADPGDSEPPSAVQDLAVDRTTQTTATLVWTAPGDDGFEGQAATYDLRFSSQPISEANWAGASRANGEPTPRPAGDPEVMTVGGLSPDRAYYFALKTQDEVGNSSAISNVANGRTLPTPADETPPSPIDDLASEEVRFDRALIGWTETGDDGTSGTADRFELRMSAAVITEENWSDASVVTGVPDPDGPYTPHQMWVRNLVARRDYFFAIRAIDDAGNESLLSNLLAIETPAAPDTLPPGRIRDLWGTPLTPGLVELTWTAPGDSATGERIAAYEIRVQTTPLDGGFLLAGHDNGASADSFEVEEPARIFYVGDLADTPLGAIPLSGDPLDPGETEVVEIDGLNPNTRYYCAVRSADAENNWSQYSNEVPVTTLPEIEPPPQEDETPPSNVADLALDGAGTDWLRLTWTAPGDDGNDGIAHHYELRMAADTITTANWSSATLLVTSAPDTAGTIETITAEGLDPASVYYFGIRTYDAAQNVSGLSNVVRAETEPVLDLAAPLPVTDLAVIDSTETALMLHWTTPADTIPPGAAGSLQVAQYDLRYAVGSLSLETWESATNAPAPEPRSPGEDAVWTLSNLAPGTTFAFGIRSRDAAGNWSEISNVAIGKTKQHVEDPPPPTPDEIAPAPVTNVELTVTDSWTAQLAWIATGDDTTSGTAADYQVRRLAGTEEFPPDPTREGAWEDAVHVTVRNDPRPSGEIEAMTLTSLSPGWFYTFGIRAIDDAGNVGPVVWSSIEQTPFVLDELSPMAVEDLAVQVIDSTAVYLGWTAPVDPRSGELAGAVAGYVVARSDAAIDDDSFESAPWHTTWNGAAEPGEVEQIVMDGLTPGSTVHFALRSIDPAGNVSPMSNGVHITLPRGEEPPDDPDPPVLDVTPPARITTFTGYALGPTAMRLNWIASGDDGAEGRALRTTIRWSRDLISEASWAGLDSLMTLPLPSAAGSVERYDWTGLEPGATYYLALRVVDDAGNASPLSNVITVVLPELQDTAPPAVPAGLQASLRGDAGVQLAWTPGADADLAGYHVYRRRVGETQRVALAENLATPSFLDTQTQAGTSYAYSVSARDVTGNLSALSTEVVVAIPQSEAALVVAVRERGADPIDTQQRQLVLRWRVDAGPDLKGFRVYREAPSGGTPSSTEPGPSAIELTTELLEGAGPHYFAESPLPTPGSYLYWIEAVGHSGATVYLEPIVVEVAPYVDAILSIYPNPVADRISVSFELQVAAPVRVSIYGADGRVLHQETLGSLAAGRQEWSWDLNVSGSRELPAGSYFLVFEAGRQSQRERFVILRGRG